MELSSPTIITSRLMAGVRVDDAEISIEYDGTNHEGRTRYRYWIDIKGEPECTDNDLHSGVGGGDLNNGLRSLLSFLSACGESVAYARQTGRTGENDGLFPKHVAAWCDANSDELTMLGIEVEESNPIDEN